MVTTNGPQLNLVAIQLVSCPDIAANFSQIEAQLTQLKQPDRQSMGPPFNPLWPTLVVLPEGFALFGGHNELNAQHAEPLGSGEIQQRLAELAQKYQVYLVAGTIPTLAQASVVGGAADKKAPPKNKFYASSLVYNPAGQLIGDYQKIHLFDADVADSTASYRESDSTAAGVRPVICDINGISVGLAVCYDLRFGGLFASYRRAGAQILVIPSAFTARTGDAHWHTLLRARAIENQCYVVAAAQGGIHANGRQTYGHSLIVDPWGAILSEIALGEGLVHGLYNADFIRQIRQNMPILQHDRFINRRLQGFSD